MYASLIVELHNGGRKLFTGPLVGVYEFDQYLYLLQGADKSRYYIIHKI